MLNWARSGITKTKCNFRRNLIYHIYPIKDSLWQWNVESILKHFDIFTGRKVIGIVIDDKIDDLDKVRTMFNSFNCEFLINNNNPRLGEVVTFREAIKLIQTTNQNEITFYAHAKGVARNNKFIHPNAPLPGDQKRVECCVKSWANTMYELNLRFPIVIDHLLRTHSSVGCFKMRSGGGILTTVDQHRWHYSGSFFWFRHDKVFSGNWRNINNNFWGVENYLCKLISSDNAFCLCKQKGEGGAERGNLYYLKEASYCSQELEKLEAFNLSLNQQ